MKRFIKQIGQYQKLYRDDKNGIAWIEDESTGLGYSIHSNIDSSGSVTGMKNLGYWGKKDRIVRSHGFIYNIDKLSYCEKEPFEMIVLNECRCQVCVERKEIKFNRRFI